MVHYSDFHLDSRIQRQARALAERGDEVDLVCLGEPAVEIRVGPGGSSCTRVMRDKPRGGYGAYLGGYARFLARRAAQARGPRAPAAASTSSRRTTCPTSSRRRPRAAPEGTPVILNVHDTFPELFATQVRALAARSAGAAGRARGARVGAPGRPRHRRHPGGARPAGLAAASARAAPSVVMNTPDERRLRPRARARHDARRRPDPVALPRRPGAALRRRAADPRGRPPQRLARARHAARDRLRREDRDRLAALAAEIAPERIDVAADPVPFAQIPGELEPPRTSASCRRSTTTSPSCCCRSSSWSTSTSACRSWPRACRRSRTTSTTTSVRLFDPGSPAALAAAVEDILHDPAAAQARAARATDLLAPLGWTEQRRRYLAMVDELTA